MIVVSAKNRLLAITENVFQSDLNPLQDIPGTVKQMLLQTFCVFPFDLYKVVPGFSRHITSCLLSQLSLTSHIGHVKLCP